MEELFNMMANAWDGGLSEMQGSALSHDMMEDSIARANDFFQSGDTLNHFDDMVVSPSGFSFGLDSLYSHANLSSMGIVGQNGLDMMMAHEGTSHILQGIDLGFTAYQKELCSDFMAGVRAGISRIDISQMADYMSDHQFGSDMPPCQFRMEAINEGLSFAQDYIDSHGEAPDFSASLKDFQESEAFDNGDVAQLVNERELWDDTVQHYEDKLNDDVSLEGNIDEYRDVIEHCFAARAEYDLLSDKISDHLTERLAKGETTGSIGKHGGGSISFTSRESMRPYDEYSIYDPEHPKLNPFGVYAMSQNHGSYPPTDFIEKPNLPNDFTLEQLQEASNKICDLAGIKRLPVFITNDVPNAEFQTMRGPFRFTIFDDRICVNPDYIKASIEHFGNTDSLLLDLAHEIGHELNSLYCGKLSRYMDEKLADMFSGMVADKMGIDIEVARQWDLWMYDGVGESEYPPSEERWDIKAAGYYYSNFATVEDYKEALRDMHFRERVHDYSTDPVTTLAQQELDYQLNRPHGIKEDLKDILDGVKKYLTIERI